MTAKEGLARLRAVRENLGEPGEWPEDRSRKSGSPGCIAQQASGKLMTWSIEAELGLGRSMVSVYKAYDARDPVALDAALDALEREIAWQEATP